MAEHKTETIGSTVRTEMTLTAGERVFICRCMKSADFPFCDGTHRQHEGTGPCVVIVPEAQAES